MFDLYLRLLEAYYNSLVQLWKFNMDLYFAFAKLNFTLLTKSPECCAFKDFKDKVLIILEDLRKHFESLEVVNDLDWFLKMQKSKLEELLKLINNFENESSSSKS